MKTPVSRR